MTLNLEPSGPMQNGMTYIVRPRMRAREKPRQLQLHLVRVAPVVRRSGVHAALRADERAVLHARHVVGIAPGEKAVGTLLGIEPAEGARLHELIAQDVPLGVGAVAPVNAVRLEEGGVLIDPLDKSRVLGHDGRTDIAKSRRMESRGVRQDTQLLRQPARRRAHSKAKIRLHPARGRGQCAP